MRRIRRLSRATSALLIIWAAFCGWVLWGWLSVRGLEEPSYELVQRHEGYDVRRYESLLAAQVSVAGSWEGSMEQGFALLSAYLQGDNTTQESIAVTRPVGMEPEGQDLAGSVPVFQQEKAGVWLISFVMPPRWTEVTIPRPNDPRVRIVHLPARTVAAMPFPGRMTREQAGRREARLRELLARDKAVIVGAAWVAQYHLPWTPPFLRRNELLIPLR